MVVERWPWPRQCWAGLVDWPLRRSRWPWAPIDRACHADAARCGACYCGTLRQTVQHEPSEACAGRHCYEHHVDEDPDGTYLACLECGHVYRTAAELRRAYRRLWDRLVRADFRRWPIEAAALWLGSRFRRARSVRSCPYCAHDL